MITQGSLDKLKEEEDVCKVARKVVGGARGPVVIIMEVIQCKVD